MRYTKKNITIRAIDKVTYNIALDLYLRNGYEYINGSGRTLVNEEGTTYYCSTLIRIEDMRYKLFGV